MTRGTASAPRVALVHATPLAVAPIAETLARLWPAAQAMNLLDDSLPRDVASCTQDEIDARFLALARYARQSGAQAVLFTCSAFGAAIDAARRQVLLPMLKPNEAMFDEALALGPRIALLTTFAPALAPMQAELLAAAAGRRITLTTHQVPGAFEALQAGRVDEHDERIVAAAAALATQDVVMLAQFSMARALGAVQQRLAAPVLCSPDSAVRRLMTLTGG